MGPNEKWRTTDPSRTSNQVAQHFADELFEGRKIVNFTGTWTNLKFQGDFQLAGGLRTYKIRADQYGEYEISVKS